MNEASPDNMTTHDHRKPSGASDPKSEPRLWKQNTVTPECGVAYDAGPKPVKSPPAGEPVSEWASLVAAMDKCLGMDEADEASPPASIPGYEILRELGRGGMGVVYEARHVPLNRIVALKMILHAAHAGTMERKRFQEEAEAVARLRHPHIVQIHDVGEHEGAPFFSLEFCPGGSLAKKLKANPLPAEQAAALMQTLARAVHAAHLKGIVHRDLKPANILLGEDGAPKVADFGLAKLLDRGSRSEDGAIVGTPSYMAPEQVAGNADLIGPGSDVYGLGAILYECLTGRPPFLASSNWGVYEMVRTVEPVPPSRMGHKVPRDLDTICLKCLEKAPGKRYASAEELADDLGRFLEGKPIRARPVPWWERTWKWAKLNRAAASFLATMCVVVVVFAAGGWFSFLSYRQLAKVRDQIVQNVDRGRDAQTAGQVALERKEEPEALRLFADARRYFEGALESLAGKTNAEDKELRAKIRERLAQVRPVLDALTRRQEMQPRMALLEQDKNQILYRETSPTEGAQRDNLAQVRRIAREALARFGVTSDLSPAQAVALLQEVGDPVADADLVRAVREGCCEVLLAWAEAEAQAGMLPGRPAGDRQTSARQAIHLLDVAAALGQAFKSAPSQTYYLRRARYLHQWGDEGGAAREQAAADGMGPTTALDHFLAGLEDYRKGRISPALKACRLALNQQPGHYWAQYLQALCHLKIKRWSEAAAGFTACLGRQPGDCWPALLRGVAHAGLGRSHAQSKDLEAARQEFESAEADFDRALALARTTGDPLALYVVLTNRGVLRGQQKRWDDAAADLKEAITVQPADSLAHVNLAEVRRQNNDRNGAVAAMTRALECRPGDGLLYYTRAQDYLAMPNAAAARRDLEEAIKRLPVDRDPDRLASAWVELGVLKYQAGNLPEALDDFAQALAVRPNYPPALRQQAQTLLKQKQDRAAGAALDLYIRHGPPAADVYLARGLLHIQFHEHAMAVEALSRSLMLHANVEAFVQRGWSYLALKAPELALADFERALKLQPAQATALCGRGTAKVLLGRVSEAVLDAEAALGLPLTTKQELMAACIYARAAGLLALTESKRGLVRPEARYEERSADLVRKTLQRVPESERSAFWRKNIQSEPALKTIRQHPKVAPLALGFAR